MMEMEHQETLMECLIRCVMVVPPLLPPSFASAHTLLPSLPVLATQDASAGAQEYELAEGPARDLAARAVAAYAQSKSPSQPTKDLSVLLKSVRLASFVVGPGNFRPLKVVRTSV